MDSNQHHSPQIDALKNENDLLRAQLQREVAEIRRLQGQLQIERTTKEVLQAEVDKYYHHLGFECLGNKVVDRYTNVNVSEPGPSHSLPRAVAIPASTAEASCPIESRQEDIMPKKTAGICQPTKLKGPGSSLSLVSNVSNAMKKTVAPPPTVRVKKEPEPPVIDLVSDSPDDDDPMQPKSIPFKFKEGLSQPLCQVSPTEKVLAGVFADKPEPPLPSGEQEPLGQIWDAPLEAEQTIEANAIPGPVLQEDRVQPEEPQSASCLGQQEQEQVEEEFEYFSNPEDRGQPDQIAENVDVGPSTSSRSKPDGVEPVIEPVPVKDKRMRQSSDCCLDDFPSNALRRIFHSRFERSGVEFFPINTRTRIVDRRIPSSRLRKMCGGGDGTSLCTKFAEAELKRYTRVLFPVLKYNPFLPRFAGAPGLYLATHISSNRPAVIEPREKDLVAVEYDGRKCNVLGEYEFEPAESLTFEEFQLLPDECKKAHVDEVRESEMMQLVLMQLSLRRTLGRTPSDEEEREGLSVLGRGGLMKITDENLRLLFLVRTIEIKVWTMKCVGYSEAFKQRLLAYKCPKNDAPKDNMTLDHFFSTANLRSASQKQKEVTPVAKRAQDAARSGRVELEQNEPERLTKTSAPRASQVAVSISSTSNAGKRQRRVVSDDESYKESSSDVHDSDDDIYRGLRRRRRRRRVKRIPEAEALFVDHEEEGRVEGICGH